MQQFKKVTLDLRISSLVRKVRLPSSSGILPDNSLSPVIFFVIIHNEELHMRDNRSVTYFGQTKNDVRMQQLRAKRTQIKTIEYSKVGNITWKCACEMIVCFFSMNDD